MKNYKFIFKPLFFIFNLVFATWLVFKIESIAPSDFGRYRSIFEESPETSSKKHKKKYLKKLFGEYKTGTLDSLELEKKLDIYLSTPKEISVK